MSILKSTNSGIHSELNLDYLRNRGYTLSSVEGTFNYSFDAPETFPGYFLAYIEKYNPYTLGVHNKNGVLSFTFTITNEKEYDTSVVSVKTFRDLILVEKYMDLLWRSKHTTQLLGLSLEMTYKQIKNELENTLATASFRTTQHAWVTYSAPRVI